MASSTQASTLRRRILAPSSDMDSNVKPPALKTVLADLNDVETKLEQAKQKYARMDPSLIQVKYNLQKCEVEIKELEKSKKFYEAKFEENSRAMDKTFFKQNKCELSTKCFENYKGKEMNIAQDGLSGLAEKKDVLEEELLVKAKEDLKEVAEKNNKSYKEMLEKISNINGLVLIE